MKKSSLFLALSLMACIGLTGCNNNTSVEPEKAVFPTKDVIAFYDNLGLDVVIPSYELASVNGKFDVDTSTEGYFDIYPTDTTSAELVAYKDALKADGWTVVSADEETSEDFRLRFGETIAYVDLLDYTSFVEEGEAPCNLISFYTYEEPEISYDAAKVTEDFNANLAEASIPFAAEWNEDYQEYGLAVNFGESTDESEKNLGSAALTLASFLPEYMVNDFAVYGDPNAEDYYDLFGDKSYYYYVSFVSPDGLSTVAVISYIYNGLLVAQISIANV